MYLHKSIEKNVKQIAVFVQIVWIHYNNIINMY